MAFSTRPLTSAAIAGALLAALSLPALAQSPAAPAQADAATTAPHPHRGHGKDMRKQRAESMQHRAAELKTKLQLTAEQEPAWTAFTESMKPQPHGARLDAKGLRDLTTPERIDRMRAMRAQHSAEADRRGEATKTFYAQLNPAQQKTFDAQSLGMGPRMHAGGPSGRPHGKGPAATPAP